MNVGIVVIGRNEGARLMQCLASVCAAGCPVIYVDSGSSDDSVKVAASLGVDVLELDRSCPFSAARARNEGFESLTAKHSGIKYVQFVDGDCTLVPGWIEAAAHALADVAKRAAVIGHVIERDPESSSFNRLCALEWRSPPGDLKNFGYLGGISMMRADVFRQLGGFRQEVIAGEDSELGVRMSLAGNTITKIDCPMATHDAGIKSFGQWWRRTVRAGHAIGQRSDLHGSSALRDCVRERYSTLFWGLGLPLVALLAAFPTRGASLVLLLGYGLLGFRIWRYRRSIGDVSHDAFLYALYTVIGKFANALGLLKYWLNKLNRRYEIIEYK